MLHGPVDKRDGADGVSGGAGSRASIAEYEARITELERKVRSLQEQRQAPGAVQGGLKHFFERYAIIGIWIMVIAALALMDNYVYGASRFLTAANFSTMLGTQGVLVILTLGLLLPLTAAISTCPSPQR